MMKTKLEQATTNIFENWDSRIYEINLKLNSDILKKHIKYIQKALLYVYSPYVSQQRDVTISFISSLPGFSSDVLEFINHSLAQ